MEATGMSIDRRMDKDFIYIYTYIYIYVKYESVIKMNEIMPFAVA